MNNIPKGWHEVEAYTNGVQVVICGMPPTVDEYLPEEQQHNCDAMGCGSVGPHVIARAYLNEPLGFLAMAALDNAEKWL